jgi:hypothetical protein
LRTKLVGAEHFQNYVKTDSGDASAPDTSASSSAANKFRSEIEALKPPVASTRESISETYSTLKTMAQGAAEEITNHPDKVLADVVIGAGIGAIVKFPKVALGLGLAIIGGEAAVTYHDGGNVLGTVKHYTGLDTPDFQEKPQGEADLKKSGAQYVDTAAKMVGGFLAYKLLGKLGKSAGAAAMNEVSALNSSELPNTHLADSVREITEALNSDKQFATASQFKLNPDASLFKSTARLPSIHDGPGFVAPREMRLPRISDGPQFDFPKSKE